MSTPQMPPSILKQHGTSHKEPMIAHQYAISTNTPITPVRFERLEQHAPALRQGVALPVGTVEFIRKAMQLAGIVEPANLSYPEVLRSYLLRRVRSLAAGHVLGHWFIKPTTTKAFTGFVFDTLSNPEHLDGHDRIQYQAFLDLPPETPVWVSEPVRWVAEHRYYVIAGQIRGGGRYDAGPDDRPSPDLDIVREMAALMASEPNAPVAFSLDVGVLDTGETALVECNDAWALGFYSGTLSRSDYIELLWVRWQQLLSSTEQG